MPCDEEVTQRAGSLRSRTGLTEAECMALLPHFEHALVVYRPDRTIDGPPRTSRRDRSSEHGPLPTIADTLRFMLTYLQQHPSQEVHGQLCGMSQSHANTWIHLLPPVLTQAFADQTLLPARTADALTALLTTPPREASAPASLVFMMGRHAPSSVRKTQRSSTSLRVARSEAPRSKTSS